MTSVAAFVAAMTVAADVVAVDALWRSRAWRGAGSLLLLALVDAGLALAMMVWPLTFYTPAWVTLQHAACACFGAGYAAAIAFGLPERARRFAQIGLEIVVVGTAIAILIAFFADAGPRGTYRILALEQGGAAGSVAVVLLAGCLHNIRFSGVARRALTALAAYYLVQLAATAPFEWSLPAGRTAQVLASGVYVGVVLGIAQAARASREAPV